MVATPSLWGGALRRKATQMPEDHPWLAEHLGTVVVLTIVALAIVGSLAFSEPSGRYDYIDPPEMEFVR